MHPFEKLLVWKRAHALSVRLYSVTAAWRDFGLRDQVRRAAASIAANIAEGAGRQSSQRELARFVSIALASAAELRSLMLLSRDVGLARGDESEPIDRECEELRRMLTAFRKRVLERAEAQSR
jgi:four helix bundle protein